MSLTVYYTQIARNGPTFEPEAGRRAATAEPLGSDTAADGAETAHENNRFSRYNNNNNNNTDGADEEADTLLLGSKYP